jgi:hypothetical protein
MNYLKAVEDYGPAYQKIRFATRNVFEEVIGKQE